MRPTCMYLLRTNSGELAVCVVRCRVSCVSCEDSTQCGHLSLVFRHHANLNPPRPRPSALGYVGPLCARCDGGYYRDGLTEECVNCDSEEAAKSSNSPSVAVLPIVVGSLFLLAFIFTIAVNRPGKVQDWWNRLEERLMVRTK